MELEKVNVIGMKWVHKYAKLSPEGGMTNELLEVECSEEDYKRLANNEKPPVIEGYEWVASVERHKFDTPTGDLENGQYYDRVERIVKIEGNNPCGFDVVKNEEAGLTADDHAKIEADVNLTEKWEVVERRSK